MQIIIRVLITQGGTSIICKIIVLGITVHALLIDFVLKETQSYSFMHMLLQCVYTIIVKYMNKVNQVLLRNIGKLPDKTV